MHKFGFFFRTRDRNTHFACPCCKNSSVFNNPEYNYEEFVQLSQLSNNEIYLEKHNVVFKHTFGEDENTLEHDEPIGPVRINSINAHEYKETFQEGNFYLRIPYKEGFLMKCRLCNEEALYYDYNPVTDLPTAFYTGMSADEDYKRIHVNIKGYYVTTFSQKVQSHYYMTRIVFNKRIGRVTVLQPLGPNNRPLSILPKYSPMWNVTFGKINGRRDLVFLNNEPYILNDFKEKAVPLLLKALQERFPYVKNDHFDECFTRFDKIHKALNLTIQKYRFHDLPTDFLLTIKRDEHNHSKILSQVGYLSSQQVSDLVKIAGRKLPKSLRKEAMKSLSSLYFIKHAKFIKSSANMIKMIERFSGNQSRFRFDDLAFFAADYLEALKTKNQGNFKNEDKLYEHCETILVNRLVSENGYYLNDTFYMYREVKEQADYDINTDLSFRQLHDDLSGAQRKLSSPNRELTYTEKEQGIEWEHGPYKFTLAHDTHFLIDVGACMDICVGGYGNRAYDKSLHIIVVSSPENPYECCIEMSGNMKSVKQAKIKYNKKPQGELLEAIQKWIEEKELTINTYDLPRDNPELVERQVQPLQRIRAINLFDEEEEDDLFEPVPVAMAE